MKIVHLCLSSFFPDGFSYQENLLPKFHKEQGHEVEVIASLVTFNKAGKNALYEGPRDYVNEHGIHVIRLDYKKPVRIYQKLRRYVNFKETLEKTAPNVLFVHNCQFLDIDIVARYAKEHKIPVFVDNHADFMNSATNAVSKYVLHGVVWKWCAHRINPYARKFWGVLPARVDFLKNVYGLPAEKCDLLVMGADDGMIEKVRADGAREKVRAQYGVEDGEILLMTGGKINNYRPEVLNLLEAVAALNNPKVKILFFGSVHEEYKKRFDELCALPSVINAGWLDAEGMYRHMEASDLVLFPGLHSVLWEQAVGMGKPCVFRKIEGFDHVSQGGNCEFMEDVSVEGIKNTIEEILSGNKLIEMKQQAERVAKLFLYSDIAKRAVKD